MHVCLFTGQEVVTVDCGSWGDPSYSDGVVPGGDDSGNRCAVPRVLVPNGLAINEGVVGGGIDVVGQVLVFEVHTVVHDCYS